MTRPQPKLEKPHPGSDADLRARPDTAAVKVRKGPGGPTLLPHRRATFLGLLISSICHLVILSLFFWCLRLALQTKDLEPVFDAAPTLWNLLSFVGGWSTFWVVSAGLAAFTLVSWPFHGLFIKVLGVLPLLYGITRQL